MTHSGLRGPALLFSRKAETCIPLDGRMNLFVTPRDPVGLTDFLPGSVHLWIPPGVELRSHFRHFVRMLSGQVFLFQRVLF